jgi:hypothetical protein
VKYRNSKGDFYFGDYKNGRKNGKGVYLFSNGYIYSGEFEYGIRNGKGIDFYSNGEAYCGEFVNGNRTGKGMHFYSDGRIRSGEYREGMANGKGMGLYLDGKLHSGLCKNGKAYGSGRMYYPNGHIEDNYTLLDPSSSISNNINLEKIIFNLLSDINKLGKSLILCSLISKKPSNLYFPPHTVLLYGYYREIGRNGIIIIDSLFFLFYFLFVLF